VDLMLKAEGGVFGGWWSRLLA